jgi:replication factor C small subunit
MNDLKSMIWQEKYRPKSVADVITPFKEQIISAMSNPMSLQNFIFYSRMGGTGKTSLSKAMVNDLKCDYLSLNASDERSIDTVRSKVKDFMLTQSSNSGCKKCIIMDEGEKLTKDASDALKNMMEEYSSNCFIILTTNNLSKISEPLQTRFKILEFTQPNKEDVWNYLQGICLNENLEFTPEGLFKLIDIHYPSIRKMVNHLQDLFNQGKSVIEDNVLKNTEVYDGLWGMIKSQKYNELKHKIITEGVDCEELNKFIFDVVDDI